MEKEIIIKKSSNDDWALMVRFNIVAINVVKEMITKWTPIALNLGNANAGAAKLMALFGTICIFIGRTIEENTDLWIELEKSLSQEEYRYLVVKVVSIFEDKYQNNQYQLVLTCMGTGDANTFFDSAWEYFEKIYKSNKQYKMLPVTYSRYAPVIPVFGKKGVLVPPELREDLNFIVLIATVGEVSFFFDTLQAPHFKDVSILVKGGMPYDEMRKVNKKPESRYDYTEMSEFIKNVLGDLLKAFQLNKHKVNQVGKLINFNIQGEQIGKTLMEVSAILLYGHYYVTLHCYPAGE